MDVPMGNKAEAEPKIAVNKYDLWRHTMSQFWTLPMPIHKYMDWNASAAMPATKRSAGITPEVNLRILLHAGNEAHKRRDLP